jgi:hypothetical protein
VTVLKLTRRKPRESATEMTPPMARKGTGRDGVGYGNPVIGFRGNRVGRAIGKSVAQLIFFERVFLANFQ